MFRSHRIVPGLVLSLALLAVGACGSRKSAATQTTPAAFDASKSDPKAIAIADQVLAAVGGEANWGKAKEIIWFQAIVVDGNVKDASEHSWDRWNGRHRLIRLDPSGSAGTTMHDLFDGTGTAHVSDAEGNHSPAMAGQRADMIKEATRRWAIDSYMLTMFFKLKDPGVKLAYVEERREIGAADPNGPMKYDVIKVSFDEGVGPSPGDVYYILVDKESHLPDVIEIVPAGKADDNRLGYRLSNWVDIGGLKFPQIRDNIGYAMQPDAKKGPIVIPAPMRKQVGELPPLQVTIPGEQYLFQKIEVRDSPTDDHYVPQISTNHQGGE
jgi:hypothetical protein